MQITADLPAGQIRHNFPPTYRLYTCLPAPMKQCYNPPLYIRRFQPPDKTAMKRPAALMLLLALSLPATAADTPNSDSDGQNEADKPTLIERVKSKLSPKSDETTSALKQKYPVRIEAQPADVKEMLQEHLPLITQQLEEELDAEQMEFLAEETPEQVLTMLKTKGYFNGKVTVSRKGMGYLVSVDSGPQTKIDNVSVAILGV